MGNTYGAVHGGIVFSFADTCFGLAANSRDIKAVTASAEIHYIAPAPVGDVIRAIAKETWRGERSGLYDVEIRDPENTVLALMRARARILPERVIPQDWSPSDQT